MRVGSLGLSMRDIDAAPRPGRALSVLTVDSPVPEEMLTELHAAVQADLFRQIEITEP